jgi:hypothetical protein
MPKIDIQGVPFSRMKNHLGIDQQSLSILDFLLLLFSFFRVSFYFREILFYLSSNGESTGQAFSNIFS